MDLRSINEAFKREYSSVLTESVDTSEQSQLKSDLLKECKYIKQTGGNIHILAEALHNVIEKHYPDHCWWEVTSCNIVNESLNGCTPEELCNNIVSGLKEEYKSSKVLKEYWLENEYDAQDIRDYIKASPIARKWYAEWFEIDNETPPPIESVPYKVLDDMIFTWEREDQLRAFIRNRLKRNPQGIPKLVLAELNKIASWYDTHYKSCYCELRETNIISGAYTFRHDVRLDEIAKILTRRLKQSYGRSQFADYNIELILNIDDYDEWDQTAFIYGTISNPIVKTFRFNDDGEGDWGSPEYAQLLNRFRHIDAYSLHGPESYDGGPVDEN